MTTASLPPKPPLPTSTVWTVYTHIVTKIKERFTVYRPPSPSKPSTNSTSRRRASYPCGANTSPCRSGAGGVEFDRHIGFMVYGLWFRV
jgi:hypothetical protein